MPRGDKKTYASVIARIPQALAAQVQQYASQHRCSVSELIRDGLELHSATNGGVPFVSKRWDGNTADTVMFQERVVALLATFQRSPTPRYLVVDSKLYNAANTTNLRALGFITRLPNVRYAGTRLPCGLGKSRLVQQVYASRASCGMDGDSDPPREHAVA